MCQCCVILKKLFQWLNINTKYTQNVSSEASLETLPFGTVIFVSVNIHKILIVPQRKSMDSFLSQKVLYIGESSSWLLNSYYFKSCLLKGYLKNFDIVGKHQFVKKKLGFGFFKEPFREQYN